MGFFGNHAANQGKHAITTVIAEGCILNGRCRVNSDIQVDGKLDGEIDCCSTVIISSSGKVNGELRADKVIINGLFEGLIYANTIEILAQGKAQGVVHTDNLCIERGGSFLGETHAAQSQRQSLLLNEQQTTPLQVALKSAK